MSHEVDGTQYVAVLPGNSGAAPLSRGFPMPQNQRRRNGRILAFRLDGQAALAGNGMVSFTGRIDAAQAEDLRAWVVNESRRMARATSHP